MIHTHPHSGRINHNEALETKVKDESLDPKSRGLLVHNNMNCSKPYTESVGIPQEPPPYLSATTTVWERCHRRWWCSTCLGPIVEPIRSGALDFTAMDLPRDVVQLWTFGFRMLDTGHWCCRLRLASARARAASRAANRACTFLYWSRCRPESLHLPVAPYTLRL